MSLRSTVYALAGSVIALVATPSVVEASCIPGFDYAAFGDKGVDMGGGAITNSYDSSIGPFLTTQVNSGGDVCTNATSGGAIKLTGMGSCTVTPPISCPVNGNVCSVGDPATVINPYPGPYLSSSQSAPVTLTPVTAPVMGTNQGDLTCTSACSIPPNQTYGDVVVKDVAKLNAGTYVMKSLSVTTAAGALTVETGPVVIYITGDSGTVLDIKSITNSSLKATDLTIMVESPVPAPPAGSCSVKVNGGGDAAFAVYAPGCDITVNGNGTIYGALVGNTVKVTGGAAIHYDAALKNHGFGTFSCVVQEVSRATPIIASVENASGNPEAAIIQGTYEYPLKTRREITGTADLAAFRFPYSQGHLRASMLTGFTTTISDFSTRTTTDAANNKILGSNEVFDSATLLPNANMTSCTPFNSTCRSVFTTTQSTPARNPPIVHFNTANASTIGALITAGLGGFTATEWATVVSRIVAGNEVSTNTFKPKLGGLDRSTVAVIPRSLTAGTTRPTMIYVGGTDGMLHAFCASKQTGVCDVVGRELWAFVPRVLLQQLRQNLAIVDGSARVLDAFGDFDGDGIKTFSTILIFTTGSGDRTADRTPAVYALDVTDPGAPKVIWEYTMSSVVGAAGTFELGHGQTISAGPVIVGGAQKYAAFIQTNNGAALKDSAGTLGAGSAGSVVTAINLEDGTDLWSKQTYAYPAPRVATNGSVPMQGVPGGAVAVDAIGAGTITDVVFGTLYGDLWVLDAGTGVSRYGTAPLYSPLLSLTADFQPIGAPPAIFSDNGSLFAVATTGAYWDRSSAGQWNASPLQWIFAAKLKTTTTPIPLDETLAPGADVRFAISFGGTEKSSAQALVIGGEIVFLTDNGNINDSAYGTGAASGTAHKITLNGAAVDNTVVVAGVGAIAASGTQLFASSGKGTQRVDFGAVGTTGETVNASLAPKIRRRLWLRTL